MSYLINQSFFVRDLVIPNTGNAAVLETINSFIAKYEPQCLSKILGYELYKAFGTESSQRMVDLLGGVEYTNQFGKLAKWQGLVHGNTVDYSYTNRLLIRNDIQIQVGVTPGFNANANTVLFDGSDITGTSYKRQDFRKWKLVVSELTGRGILVLGLDYSFDSTTGVFLLLQAGDIFETNTYYNVHFEPDLSIVPPSPPVVYDISLIANYIYFYIQQTNASKTTGVNTSIPKGEKAVNFSPVDKMVSAWNFFSDEVESMIRFLWYQKDVSNVRVYPEFDYEQGCTVSRISRKRNSFGI